MSFRMPNLSRLVLISGALACAGIVFYALSRMEERAADLWPFIFYVIFPGLLSILFLGSLRLSPIKRNVLAISLTSIGVGLILAESYLIEFYGPSSRIDLRLEASKSWGYPADDRSIIEVIEDIEDEGLVAYPMFTLNEGIEENANGDWESILGDYQTLVPLGGLSNARTISCNEIGYWVDYISDKHGFRNPEDAWDSQMIELVLLGDSFTFGDCVPEEEHFSSMLRQKFLKTLNLGYPAAGPIATYATLIEYAKQLRPKVVLWFFFEGNDFLNLRFEKSFPALLKYLDGESMQNLRSRQHEIDQEIMSLISRLRPSAPRGGATTYLEKLKRVPYLREVRKTLNIASFAKANRPSNKSNGLEHKDLMEKVLSLAKQDVEGWGGKLYLVYLPAWRRGRDVDHVDNYIELVHETMVALVEKVDIPLIDTIPAFERHPEPDRLNGYPRGGGHYSKIGYHIVGKTVLEYLALEKNVIPSN